jgi:hypothetical protein
MEHVIEIDDNPQQSTTPAGISIRIITKKVVRPPLLQKEGKCIRHIFSTLHSAFVLNSLTILLYLTPLVDGDGVGGLKNQRSR